jgi:AcrR family transcriptional regulator
VRTKTPLQAEKILAAAARLFATHRFHEARMEDIAALAEVGKGTLYRYFKDKNELYKALLEQAAQELSHHLQAVKADDSPREQLQTLVAALLGFFDGHPYLFDLIQHAEVMHKPGTAFPWQKARDETLALVKQVFTAAAEAGDFLITDPDLATLLLLGGIRAVGRFGTTPRPRDIAERIVEGFLSGMARPCRECADCKPRERR